MRDVAGETCTSTSLAFIMQDSGSVTFAFVATSLILSPGSPSPFATTSPSLTMLMVLRMPDSHGSCESPSGGGAPRSSFAKAFLNTSNMPIFNCETRPVLDAGRRAGTVARRPGDIVATLNASAEHAPSSSATQVTQRGIVL